MRLSGVREGDIIEADVKGLRFLAFVRHVGDRELQIEPIHKGISRYQVSARQVRQLWRRAGRKSGGQ